MNVLRGTFRLSIVVALVVAACYGISAHIAAHDAAWEDRKHWSTLRCGERFLGQDMSKYTSPYRPEVIDIGKAGCSNSSYWATFDEIRMALASADPPRDRYSQVFWPKLYDAFFIPLGAFVVVNWSGCCF
jgi:hypothetical protein